ncbi:uncharacterized protein C8orf48 homolog isoform X2 [Hyla sarda]|uniref:uncharacterized protein C8orf48 homolog isoform X2 n=1 Tax=Hyla sarda TaxID=327740 RepID=UPI0024C46FD6|nr:uncharacterized protein C8orf48 homolog isoform X2 [Hyla sarda]
MALSPVSEESPNYKEELDDHDSLSDAPSYSGNSFEAYESNGRCKSDAYDSITDEQAEKYQSDSFESFASESSRQQESDSFNSITKDSSRNYESDSFESLTSESDQIYSFESSYMESASVEDDSKTNYQGKVLIEKWIKSLVDGNLRSNNSFQDHLKTVAHKESSGSGSKALQAYCSLKIEHLHQPSKCHRQEKDRPLMHPSKAISIHQSCPVPHELMNRLKLQRIKEAVNQVIKTEMHDPATCPDCCSKQAELAQGQFVRMKKTKLEANLLNKKIEEYMYSKDMVTCIGEILQSLPKPSVELNVI